MREIQPFKVWVNGIYKTAVYLQLLVNSDNLKDNAVFYFQLKDNTALENPYSTGITDGNITMSGVDYLNYISITNSNDFAYIWAANTLGLTLVLY